MALPKPNLDDKSFLTIAEEARALIPGNAKTWTDHNVHDPGITFVELFSWLAEMQHYRLNRVSDESYRRFFSLIGFTPESRRPAEVSVAIDFPDDEPAFAPAHSKIVSISIDDLPFETLEDVILTPVRLQDGENPQSRSTLAAVTSTVGGREIHQKLADEGRAGLYEAFGPRPAIGDSMSLTFNRWFFDEKEIRLSVTLFEDDLPPLPAPADESSFVSSVTLKWEYCSKPVSWTELKIRADGTLQLSRGGDIVFENPAAAGSGAGKLSGPYQIRATIAGGSYEIPPRIASIRTNSVRARQVETIVNEDLKNGLGTPDQTVRLKKAPVMMEAVVSDGPFQIGEVLDWRALVSRFRSVTRTKRVEKDLEDYVSSLQRSAISRIASRLDKDTKKLLYARALTGKDAALYKALLQARDNLAQVLENPELYDAPNTKEAFADHCNGHTSPARIRQHNRHLLQQAFPEFLASDRVVIQTAKASAAAAGAKGWRSWIQVANFQNSTPEDLHYTLDTETGEIRFGNGLNGKVPGTNERIRARFYHHSRADAGNVTAGLKWRLFPTGIASNFQGTNLTPGHGGAPPESIDEARFRSRAVFHKPNRAVTSEDYESQALQTPGLRVARAKAIPNFHPAFSAITYPGDVSVVVVPAMVPGAIQPGIAPPSPSVGFLATVSNFLNARRVVTTNVHVIGPQWIQVNVRARVFLKKGAAPEEVRRKLTTELNQFLHPLEGGRIPGQRNSVVQTNDNTDDVATSAGWPFGRAVFPSEICRILANTKEVEFASDVSLSSVAAQELAGPRQHSSGCISSGDANLPTGIPAQPGPCQCGSVKLYPSDFDDLASLAAKIKNRDDAVSDYIYGRLRDVTRQKLAAWDAGSTVPTTLRKAFIADLNSLVGGLSIWDEGRFAQVELRWETQELLGRHPHEPELARLNRLLLQDTYSLELSRNLQLPPKGLPYPGIHELQIFPFEHGGRARPRSRHA